MKSWTGIAAGILLILAACVLELAKSAERPSSEVRALSLELRVTPTSTPAPTSTPTPTPTPIHIQHFVPSDRELIELVAQSLPRDSDLVRSATNIQVQRLQTDARQRTLFVIGESPTQAAGEARKPAAFAAVLTWQNAEYIVTFSHALLGREQVKVSVWLGPDTATFRFEDISNARCAKTGECQPPVITHACNVPLGTEAMWRAHRNRQNPVEWGCF